MKLHVLASGSAGNAYCVESGSDLIFIDIGVSLSSVKAFLKTLPEAGKKISILITHEHSDHISGLLPFVKAFAPKIYTAEATADFIANAGVRNNQIHRLKSGGYHEEKHFALTGFHVPHDVPTFGFILMTDYGNLGFMTDCGCVTKDQLSHLEMADWLVLEANHDIEMLKKGPYPSYLKRRIASSKGHLSNNDALASVAALAGGNMKECFFAHVSEENNSYTLLEELATFAATQYDISTHVLRQKKEVSFTLL